MIISKRDFNEYVRCQNLGYFNMLDYDSWQHYTFLNKETWFYIINNYNRYNKMYNKI